jgi:putative sigma-54 modulation protein
MKTFDVNNIQLKLQAPGIKVNDDLLDYIIKHIEKLGNTNSRINKCELTLKVEKESHSNNCIAEVKLFVPGKTLFAKDQCDNFKLAFKNVFDELNNQLIKLKGKIEKGKKIPVM